MITADNAFWHTAGESWSKTRFACFVRHATGVVARIALDYERKTVKGTALFYEEILPAETLFDSVALASASRRDGHGKGPGDIRSYLRSNLPALLQMGGDETIGKGLCAVGLDGGMGGSGGTGARTVLHMSAGIRTGIFCRLCRR